MECPTCGSGMVWENDWDLLDEEDNCIQTDYSCPDCQTHISIWIKPEAIR